MVFQILVNIGSGIGLMFVRQQAITGRNDDLLSTWLQATISCEISIKLLKLSPIESVVCMMSAIFHS